MKKLFLLASVALVLASCSKDDSGSNNNPQNPGQSQQGGGQPEQPTTPTPVPVGFVKTIKEYDREVSNSSLLKTTTYKVENNLLTGWEEQYANSNNKVVNTLTYEGANLKTFKKQEGEGDNYAYIYTFSYQNNKLDKITRKRGDTPDREDVYQITLDDQGRIIKKKHIGNGGWDGQEWEATFTYADNKITIQKGEEKYIYTYTGENATQVVKEATPYEGPIRIEYQYDTAVINDLNNKYIYLTNIARLLNPRDGISGRQLTTIDSPFVLNSKNVAKNDGTNTYEIEKNDQNKPTKITQKQAGIALQIKVYSY